MASTLVETKFFVPRARRSLVSRPRLVERLSRAAEARLTVVSAPAGFGKTMMLAEWLGAGRAVAWLSLDASDSRPASFWTYAITALQRVVPGVGTSALPALQATRPPIEAVLTTVVNELSVAPHDVYLVLDDYHLVDGPEIQVGMAFLLEHLPPQVHLVVSTRADPSLPLARLRARGELVEVRAADLRFTPEEVTAYLHDVAGLRLAAGDIAVLEGRTEGWIAALQLAALSMQGRDDVAGFIAGFAGDDRYIVDYLVEEVLGRQPAPVREFLVRTSVLDRLSGSLCDAVTGQPGGRAMIESLDRGNLFVVPLDDSRRWYRYHHLFADVLHAHLLDEDPEQVPRLHRRASGWYEQNGEPAQAVRHALAAGDVERAAGLVELAIPALRRDRQEATIRGWLDAIPDDVVQVRPVLAIGFIGALMAGGEFESVERRLADAERCLEQLADTTAVGDGAVGTAVGGDGAVGTAVGGDGAVGTAVGGDGAVGTAVGGDGAVKIVVVDEGELLRLPAGIQMYRAALALLRGDAPGTIDHARRAIAGVAADDHLIRAAASGLMGLAFWGGGDLEAAHRAYAVSIDGLERAGHVSDVLGCSIALADIRSTQGRLGDALNTYRRALKLTAGTVLRGTADMYVGMSQIACERDDLPAATAYLRRAEELGEHTWLPQNPYRWRVAMARIREAEGDLDGALDLLDDALRVYVGDFSPNVRPVAATRARVLAARGRLAEAFAWAREQGLSASDELSYLREYEHITLAGLLLKRSDLKAAATLLERLLQAAEAGGRTGSVIEILVLQASTHRARGDVATGSVVLARALALGEPEGYTRIFIGDGPAPASLRKKNGLVDPLSERELDVLRLLGSDLDGPAIARELRISLNTLRTHTKSIYTKLGVNSRRAAVRRAAELT